VSHARAERLLRTQRDDRIEPGGPLRGVGPEEDAGRGGDAERETDRTAATTLAPSALAI
jgi:hypothetical protein